MPHIRRKLTHTIGQLAEISSETAEVTESHSSSFCGEIFVFFGEEKRRNGLYAPLWRCCLMACVAYLIFLERYTRRLRCLLLAALQDLLFESRKLTVLYPPAIPVRRPLARVFVHAFAGRCC